MSTTAKIFYLGVSAGLGAALTVYGALSYLRNH